MKAASILFFLAVTTGTVVVNAQTVVINDPTKQAPESEIGRAEEAIFRREALPAVRKKLESATCKESIEIRGAISGSFTRANSLQTVIFYQYCETGNGTGWVGLVLMERGDVVGNFVSNSGVSSNILKLSDIDQNGLEDFALEYAGAFDPAHSDVFIELMQFTNELPMAVGRYKSEENGTRSSFAWKVTAKTGKPPLYYRQKYTLGKDDAFHASGGNLAFELDKPTGAFVRVQ